MLALVFGIAAAWLPAREARAQDVEEEAPADTLVLPTVTTSYDRDRTRELWTETVSFSASKKRTSFNLEGNITNQNYLTSPSKSRLGNIDGFINLKLVGNWLLILHGFYDMNSSTDGPNDLNSRNNRLNIRTQYLFNPVRTMRTYLSLYSEFEQRHDQNRNDRVNVADTLDVGVVDTSFAQRDSSYTTSRNDAVSGDFTWDARSWFQLKGSALAFRTDPTITSFQRSFVNPLDGSGGGYLNEIRQRTNNPTGNTRFTSSASLSRRSTRIVVTGTSQNLKQSYFDKQRSSQETADLANRLGTVSLDSPLRKGVFLHSEGSLAHTFNEYTLNTNRTVLTNGRHLLSTVGFMDTSLSANVNFSVDRNKTELQPSSNGVAINRALAGMFRWRTGRKLMLDGNGSVTLLSNDYENDRIDRDAQRIFFSLGGGYLLTPACSTSVHFSRGRGHTVSLDPSQSSGNAVTTTYQMNATLVYLPTRNFALRQNYLISAEYRILDYVESQNSLVRARRIDTDMADTLFSFAVVRLTHNFVFQDQGTYARFQGETKRKYSVATRSYDQTVTATAGAKIAPGVLFLATQSLLNRRSEALASETRTLQNTWKLNLSLQVFRTLPDGIQIDGAVRRLSEYVEGKVNSKDTTRDDWVAGVTIHKDF